MSSFRRLGRLAAPHTGTLLASMLLLALHGLTTGAYAYLVGPLLRFIYSGGASAGTGMSRALDWIGGVPTDDPRALTSFIAALVVTLVVVKGLAYFGGSYLVAAAGQRMEHELRTSLYDHLLQIAYDHLAELPRGDMVSRFVNDVGAMKFAVTHGLTSIVRDALQIVVLAALALSLDPLLGVITLCVLPLSTTVILRIGKRLRGRRRSAFDAYGELASAAEQTVAALPVLRAFGAEDSARTQFQHLSRRVLRRNLRAWALQVFSSPLMELLGAAALAGTLWYAGRRISSGALQPEEFVSFFAAVFMMYRPIKSMGDSSALVHNGLAALDRIDGVLAMPVEPPAVSGLPVPRGIAQGIRFEDVHFAYPGGDVVLDGVTFEIGAGETVAVVGGSGAGKTTVAMMLLRLIEPERGRITLDGRELSQFDRAGLRRMIALVTQEPVLLNDTLGHNIAFGRDTTPEALEAAARAAGALELVRAHDEGFDAQVGESGRRLSGGERQRVCIARALLGDPPALILDEATASLDSATEAEITAALDALMEGRTTLLVSHRLSTIRRADRLVVLAGGVVVDQGTFEELRERSDEFRRIFADQLGE